MDEQTTDDERPVRRFTPLESADGFAHYLELRRQQLIIEIRLIEDLLGLPATFPRRVR
jgi:hypothetical protein